MKLPDLISTGWTEIRSHKMRSFLSFFAIAIGIATFFYTLSVLSQRYRDIDRAAKISGTGRIDIILPAFSYSGSSLKGGDARERLEYRSNRAV